MGVLNLNDGELLEDTVIQAQLFFLKSCHNSVTNVDSEEVKELSASYNLTLVLFNFVSHATNIICSLEHCRHSLVA